MKVDTEPALAEPAAMPAQTAQAALALEEAAAAADQVALTEQANQRAAHAQAAQEEAEWRAALAQAAQEEAERRAAQANQRATLAEDTAHTQQVALAEQTTLAERMAHAQLANRSEKAGLAAQTAQAAQAHQVALAEQVAVTKRAEQRAAQAQAAQEGAERRAAQAARTAQLQLLNKLRESQEKLSQLGPAEEAVKCLGGSLTIASKMLDKTSVFSDIGSYDVPLEDRTMTFLATLERAKSCGIALFTITINYLKNTTHDKITIGEAVLQRFRDLAKCCMENPSNPSDPTDPTDKLIRACHRALLAGESDGWAKFNFK